MNTENTQDKKTITELRKANHTLIEISETYERMDDFPIEKIKVLGDIQNEIVLGINKFSGNIPWIES